MTDDDLTTEEDGVTTTNPAWTIGARIDAETRARIQALLEARIW